MAGQLCTLDALYVKTKASSGNENDHTSFRYEPVHEISSDQQSLRSACAHAQSDQSLCLSLEYPMSVKLLTEHHLRFLSLKGGCTGSSEYTLVKMPHCWKSRVTANILYSKEIQG